MTSLSNPIFKDDEKARQALEAIRWPNGPICPHHCGSFDKIALVGGSKHRPGLYYCNSCNGTFTVTVGTVFERSKIGLSKWWLAVYLMSSSKKGVSSHQLHRTLGVTYKTAWFMSHRIREAMRDGLLGPMSGSGSTVEADETYIGRKAGTEKKRGTQHKRTVLTLVERNGRARSFHVDQATITSVTPILQANIDRESTLYTDEGGQYHYMGKSFAKHETVNHAGKEYARCDVRPTPLKASSRSSSAA